MNSFVLKAANTAKKTLNQQADLNSPTPKQQVRKIEVEDEILSVPWQIIHADPEQPRKERDPVEFLKVSNSIKQTKGNTQPVIIKKHPTIRGEYMLVAGEGRWTACKEHDLNVRSILKQDFDDELSDPKQAWNKLFVQVSENVGRNDLLLVREAESLERLVNTHIPKLPEKDIGDMLGYDKTKTSRLMKLAEAPKPIKQLSLDGISQNINMLLLMMDLHSLVDESDFSEYLMKVREKQLFERGLREIVRDLKPSKKPKVTQSKPNNNDVAVSPVIAKALTNTKCSNKLATTINTHLKRAKDEGYSINEKAISEHLESMTPASLKTFSDFDTIVDQCVALYESPTAAPQAPSPTTKLQFLEMESYEHVDGDLLIHIKGQKHPLKIHKTDAQALKAIID